MRTKPANKKALIAGSIILAVGLIISTVIYVLEKTGAIGIGIHAYNAIPLGMFYSFFAVGYGRDCGKHRKWLTGLQVLAGLFYLFEIVSALAQFDPWPLDVHYIASWIATIMLAGAPYVLTAKAGKRE